MTRPNFSTQIGGPLRTTTESYNLAKNWSWVTTNRLASEVITGTSRRKPTGWISPTAYSLLRREVNLAYGQHHLQVSGKYPAGSWSRYEGVVGWSGAFNGLNHFDECLSETAALAVPSYLANACLIAARNKLKDQSVDLGSAWGERKQTMRQLGDAATSIARAARDLQRGQVRNAMRQLGISNKKREPRGSNWVQKYLGLEYGWKPLLSDIYGSVHALSKRPTGDWRITAKSGRTEKTYTSKLTSFPARYDPYVGTVVVERKAFVRIDALPRNDLTMSLSSLGLLNPLNVGWEVLPYSFVVDWIVPIGSWLNSLDAGLGYRDSYTSTSTLVRADWSDIGRSMSSSATYYVKGEWTGKKSVVNLKRTIANGIPLPTIPSIKDPRSLKHMANGLGLLIQVFNHKRFSNLQLS